VVREEVDLPGEGARLRLVQISDVDFGGVGARERQAASLIAAAAPDLVAVTGDLLEFRDGRGERYLDAAIRFLEGLPARYGIFWVVGESERHHVGILREALEGSRVRLLYNEEIDLALDGRAISLFGAGPTTARFEAIVRDGAPWLRVRSAGLFSPLVDAEPGADDWHDYDVTGQLRFEDEFDYVGILAYASTSDPTQAYALVRHQDRHRFHLRRLGPAGAALVGDVLNGPDFVPGTALAYRLRVESLPAANRVRARVWKAADQEPATWALEGLDPAADRPRGGAAGICAKGGGDERWFSAWSVARVADGVRMGGPDLTGFDARAPRWRCERPLRDWADPSAVARPLRVLLAHNPDIVLDLAAQGAGGIDLVVTGHTQGGQIRLPFLGALYTGTEIGTHYAAGLFEYGGFPLYVNRGLGTSFIPLRLLCPPEVTVLTLPLGTAALAPADAASAAAPPATRIPS